MPSVHPKPIFSLPSSWAKDISCEDLNFPPKPMDSHPPPVPRHPSQSVLNKINSHPDLAKWMARPGPDTTQQNMTMSPDNIDTALVRTYSVNAGLMQGLLVPIRQSAETVFGFWFNEGVDEVLHGLLSRLNMNPLPVKHHVARFILDLESATSYCIEWFISGHALVSVHHFSPVEGRSETSLFLTQPVPVGYTPVCCLCHIDIRRSCPYCKLRRVSCLCPDATRDQVMGPSRTPGLIGWAAIVESVMRRGAPDALYTVFDREPGSGLLRASMQVESRSTYQYGHDTEKANMTLDFFRRLGLLAAMEGSGATSPRRPRSLAAGLPETGSPEKKKTHDRQPTSPVEGFVEKQKPKSSRRAKFPCPECGKLFKQVAHTEIHLIMVHKKERPHECERCGRRFGSKSNLNRHFRTRACRSFQKPNSREVGITDPVGLFPKESSEVLTHVVDESSLCSQSSSETKDPDDDFLAF